MQINRESRLIVRFIVVNIFRFLIINEALSLSIVDC